MLEFDDQDLEVILLRLVNNDRLIGQIVNADKDMIALYAPMLIEIKQSDGAVDYVMSPYDPLSSTPMALMAHDLIMTVTVPKTEILLQYEDTWNAFYPTMGDMRRKMAEKTIGDMEEQGFDIETLNEMFSAILNDSVPINKKKLN